MTNESSQGETYGGLSVETLTRPLAKLPLSVRAATELALANLHTVAQLIASIEPLRGRLTRKLRNEITRVLRDECGIDIEGVDSNASAEVGVYVEAQPFNMRHFDAYIEASVGRLNAQDGIEVADLERSLLPGCAQALIDSDFNSAVFNRIRRIFTATEAWYLNRSGVEERHLLPPAFQIPFMEALIAHFALRDDE